MAEVISKTPAGYEPPREAIQALEALESGRPLVYLAGRAGCGKSTFIEYLKEQRFQRDILKGLVIVAPTGISAINVGAQTIHSFLKIAPHDRPGKWDQQQASSLIYSQMTLLVIDEISMVRSDLLDLIDEKLRFFRSVPDTPFGGLPILCVGDIFQLSPIITSDESHEFYKSYRSGWFFDAKVFQQIPMICKEMKKVFRQSDPEFLGILHDIRTAQDPQGSIDKLNSATSKPLKKNKLNLTTTNAAAEGINQTYLSKLSGQPKSYFARVGGGISDADLKSFQSPQVLTLKVGARVMATANLADKGVVNGHLGNVKTLSHDSVEVAFDFDPKNPIRIEFHQWKKVVWVPGSSKEFTESERGTYTQIPLRLGYAISIHKAQGLTLDTVVIDLGKGAFASGQTYVALSRCRSLQGIHLTRPLTRKDLILDRHVVRFAREFMSSSMKVPAEKPKKEELPPWESYEVPWDVAQAEISSLKAPPAPKPRFLSRSLQRQNLEEVSPDIFKQFILSDRNLRAKFSEYLEGNK